MLMVGVYLYEYIVKDLFLFLDFLVGIYKMIFFVIILFI